jgi:hypothetical protein
MENERKLKKEAEELHRSFIERINRSKPFLKYLNNFSSLTFFLSLPSFTTSLRKTISTKIKKYQGVILNTKFSSLQKPLTLFSFLFFNLL